MSDINTNNRYSGDDYSPHRFCGPGQRIPWPLKVLGAIVLIPGILFLASWVLMLLWNAVIPGLFGLSVLTLWQAMAIMVIGRLIFGGRRGGPGHGGFPRRPQFKDREAWRSHLREHFAEEGGRPGAYGRPGGYPGRPGRAGRYSGGPGAEDERPLSDMPDTDSEK